MNRKSFLFAALLTSILYISCTTEEIETRDAGDYAPEKLSVLMPLQSGKYITYRLDSIVPTLQGRLLETHRYQIKDVVDSLIPDALGRNSYRVYRYINDSTASAAWLPLTTYFITPATEKIEVVENSLRTVNLQLPRTIGATWKGGRYLPTSAYGVFNTARFNDVNSWDFSLTGVSSETYAGQTFDSVWTVSQFNDVFDTLSVPNANNRLYGIGYSEEKYAAGFGLVAKQLIMIENNPNQIDSTTYDPYKTGFGIRMWMIDHN